MNYIDSNLMSGEKVIHRTKLHGFPLYFVPVLLIPVGGIGLIFVLAHYMLQKSSEFGVTDKRVILKTGILSKHTCELLLRKVESIGIEQGIFGSMMGYGAVTVTGTGGTKETFKGIADPLKFRKAVNEQIEALAGSPTAEVR